MASPLFADDILFLQRFLASLGLYQDTLDGDWGPNTSAAWDALEAQIGAIAAAEGTFDSRSEGHLRTLHPLLQRYARRALAALADAGVVAKVISGTRSYAEQDALYRKGRFGNPGPKVTNARGGQSNHNFCIAFDIGVFVDGAYMTTAPAYEAAAAIVKQAAPELAWGGDWVKFRDTPHYELPTGLKISEVRARFEAGQAYVPPPAPDGPLGLVDPAPAPSPARPKRATRLGGRR